MSINLLHKTKVVKGKINLTSSKSISNRVLIIQALCAEKFNINNLATAKDTVTLNKLLSDSFDEYDVGHAGTVMRFMTAFLALKEGEHIITGSERMQQRPIKILVDALCSLGVNIEYLKNEGYPPLKIKGGNIEGGNVKLDGSVSSQYISALLLIAPKLKNGLTIQFEGEVISKPYINMTIEIMRYFSVEAEWNGNEIIVKKGNYHAKDFIVEADWSSASYWYGIAALAQEAEIELYGLEKDSLQGDAVVYEIYKNFGVKTEFFEGGVKLTKNSISGAQLSTLHLDFENCPDIAQTVAVTCAALNVNARFTGLQTLRIKETDRIFALQKELTKLGFEVEVENDDLIINRHSCEGRKRNFSEANLKDWQGKSINTYEDHRMAMAFAPLALFNSITINDEDVVVKSYPSFWKDLRSTDFLNQIN